jgi:hypothetical protein
MIRRAKLMARKGNPPPNNRALHEHLTSLGYRCARFDVYKGPDEVVASSPWGDLDADVVSGVEIVRMELRVTPVHYIVKRRLNNDGCQSAEGNKCSCDGYVKEQSNLRHLRKR